jgi:penicillin amidase
MNKTVTFVCLFFAAQLSQGEERSYSVEGLEQPAEIIVDEWGVPHIYANTHYDAFFVQGFNAARDRLWQIDTWRRRGLGQLSEVFGEQYIEQDRASRLFLYRGDMFREWLAYGSDAKRIAESFTAGINAYVDLIGDNPDLLPPEFELLDYRPARWQPEDTVRIRSHGIAMNADDEAVRAQIACLADLETATYWSDLEPAWETQIPEGLDPCVIPEYVMDTYMLARAAVRFSDVSRTLADARTRINQPGVGSNNWTISPSRSATGRPILANDPHRAHSVPSLRYITHLVAPDLNVIGAGEPALPGISIGHNERIAFGLTIFGIDQSDLYVYEKVDGKYRYEDGLESFRTVTETVPVRNQDMADIALRFTRHGPVIYENDTHAFAVRAGWMQPGMAPYFGSVEYMRASNWREFVSALNRWGSPPENQVYADVDGNIGYKPAGLIPKRNGWDGLLPVPGDGRYEWDGFFDMDVLPVEFNPQRGFSGSANSMNLPDDYPIGRYPIGFEWSPYWRYDRMWQVLQGQSEHSLDDSTSLQRDNRSLLALEAIRRIPSDLSGPGVNMLRNWDGNLTIDSAAGAFYAVWYYQHLTPMLARVLLPEAPHLVVDMDSPGAIRLMSEARSRDAIALSLNSAYAAASILMGPDPKNWRWGDLHQMRFEHPLLHLAGPELASQMRYPAYPRNGSGNTTNSTWVNLQDFSVSGGASYRQVLDVGNWDAATMTNAPGQSGDPRSPFYDNLLQGWAEERDFPLLYSREKVLEHEVLRINLTPAAN